MKIIMTLGLLSLLVLSCATGSQPKNSTVGSAEKLAHDISGFLNESLLGDAENRMLEEMKISGTTGVFLINRRGETVRGYIVEAGGDIVSYRGDFKSLLLSNDDEIDEALVFYQDKMLGMVRIIRNNKKK
ncbi:MAG TPA: hypothetical protein PKK43_16290 [Spirochaetota bacterium]|nr:hypothetical protein [Spirochaetota bacterium]